jgi:hypothetical protein|tara:strand:+ start:424 stop:534 length:111 start_codon:yes stop_codon:yes gene_type:complete
MKKREKNYQYKPAQLEMAAAYDKLREEISSRKKINT